VSGTRPDYVPAAGLHALTPWYDVGVRVLGRGRLRQGFASLVDARAEQRLLDLGCGTGLSGLALVQGRPGVRLVGVDLDDAALARARRRFARAGIPAEFHCGDAVDPPVEGPFQHVTAALLVHHLRPRQKLQMFRRARELVTGGGDFHVLDFTVPRGAWQRIGFAWVRLLDGRETTEDHARGRVEDLLRDAGWAEVEERARWGTLLGSLAIWRARA
jgi:cyclopropane fatty-acyl-phospholipid synthase-like methyltransferase